MDEQNYENLAKRHPDLFQKAGLEYFSIGNGWIGIVDTLCGFISYDVNQARYKLKYAMEHQGEKYAMTIPEAEANLAKALEDLPTIQDVKEKFGGLRFYVSGASDKVYNYIEFAEALSHRTCEECGAPGERRSGGWIKTLCDTHHKSRKGILGDVDDYDDDEPLTAAPTQLAPKIADE